MLPFTIESEASKKLAVGDLIYIPGFGSREKRDTEIPATLIQPGGRSPVVLKLKNLSKDERDIISPGV